MSFDEVSFTNLFNADTGGNPDGYYSIFNSRVYDFTEFIEGLSITRDPPLDVYGGRPSNHLDQLAFKTYLAGRFGFPAGDAVVRSYIASLSVAAENMIEILLEEFEPISFFDISIIGTYEPQNTYTDEEVIAILNTDYGNPFYIVNVDGTYFDITAAIDQLRGTYEYIIDGGLSEDSPSDPVTVFNRFIGAEPIPGPPGDPRGDLDAIKADILVSFNGGFPDIAKFGRNTQAIEDLPPTDQESRDITSYWSTILFGGGFGSVRANNFTQIVVIGDIPTIDDLLNPLDPNLNTDDMLRDLFNNGPLVEKSAAGTLGTDAVSYIRNDTKSAISSALRSLQYNERSSMTLARFDDILSDSHRNFILNLISSNIAEGVLVFYTETSDIPKLLSQIEIVATLGARTFIPVLIGLAEDPQNDLPRYRQAQNNLLLPMTNLFANLASTFAGFQIPNILTSSVRKEQDGTRYLNVIQKEYEIQDTFALNEAIRAVVEAPRTNALPLRVLITEPNAPIASAATGGLIYGTLIDGNNQRFKISRTIGGQRELRDLTVTQLPGQDLFRSVPIFTGPNVNLLRAGDLIYGPAVGARRNDPLLRDVRELTVIATFAGGFSTAVTPNVTSLYVQIGDGVAFDSPIRRVTIQAVQKRLDQNTLEDLGDNGEIDEFSDYVLRLRVPPNVNLPAELYSQFSILGLLTIYDSQTGGPIVGRAAVIDIMR